MIRKRWMASLAALLMALTGGWAQAQVTAFPTRPITLVVPSAPGGLPDTMARAIARHMGQRLGQQVVVENRSGAGGIVAAQTVAQAPGDGYTLLVGDQGQLAINPVLFKQIPYNPTKDFVAVSMIGTSPLFLLLHPSVPVSNLQELVALVKAHPKKYSYGSTGIGSLHHITMENLKTATGMDIVHIPYRGTAAAMPALVGNEVQILLSALPAATGFLQSGKVKLVAVNTAQRSAQAPNVATIAESINLADFAFPAEIGLLAPKGTPPQVVSKLSDAVAAAVNDAETKELFLKLGIEPVGGSADQFRKAIELQTRKYAKAVKIAGLEGAE